MTYYISPRFLDKIAVHITKNFLDLPGLRVPLILGIHGRKGEGKSFQCELIFQKMGVEVVHMSAGELESPDAGDPARLIRLRYREAAELIKVRGKMSVLMINDLDAGAGRFDATTQYTVNTQLVNGTLMNIADNPTNVQLPGSYDATPIHRVPILVTGNDFSTLYEPLIRDGRMEKFYWEPDREDKIGIIAGIFAPDELSASEIEQLVDTFPNQAIDFFGALRSRIYDEQIRQFIYQVGIDKVSFRVIKSADGPPIFPKPNFSLSRLVEFGNLMVREQDRVREMGLARQYNQVLRAGAQSAEQGSVSSTQIAPQSGAGNGSAGQRTPNPTLGEGSNGNAPRSRLSAEVQQQVQQLVSGGFRIGVEYVDERRFRTNSWNSCATITAGQESDAIAALEQCLSEHSGEYVRLIGIEPKAKRRVVETIVQRPNG
jgi:ribulose bisphosphate carboxylase small subunit